MGFWVEESNFMVIFCLHLSKNWIDIGTKFYEKLKIFDIYIKIVCFMGQSI